MRGLDVFEAEHLRRLGPIGAGSDAIDDVLERNLGEREFRRAGDDGASEGAELNAARHLKYRLKRQRPAAAEKSDKADLSAPPRHQQRIQHGGVADDVEHGVDAWQMRDYVQCVIRDTARHSEPRDYFLVEGARSWTVSDQLMKKELIVQGMGWGHMPGYLVEQNFRDGSLLPIKGRHFKGGEVDLVAARRRDTPQGPVANRLWQFIADQAVNMIPAVNRA